MRLIYATLGIIAIFAVMAACGDDDDDNGGSGSSTEPGPDFLLTDVEDLVLKQIDRTNAGIDEGDPATLDDEQLRDVLATMVLQVEDLPEGLDPLGGSYSTNEESAQSLNSVATKEQLDEWGRILGYQTDYRRSSPPTGATVIVVSSSISVYETTTGAQASFDNAVSRARNVDWEAANADLEEFDLRELSPDLAVDGLYWIRISGYQQVTPDSRAYSTDDQIVFRIGQAWGFLRTISTGPEV